MTPLVASQVINELSTAASPRAFPSVHTVESLEMRKPFLSIIGLFVMLIVFEFEYV